MFNEFRENPQTGWIKTDTLSKSNKNKNYIQAEVVGHESTQRQNFFDSIYSNIEVGDIVRVMGTGATNFLHRKDRIRALLKEGNNIEILIINDQVVKGDFQCSSDDFIRKIKETQKEFILPNQIKTNCPLYESKFLIDTVHFNNYHNREDYNKRIQESLELIREYQNEFDGSHGKISAKHFKSFVPLSITAIFNEKTTDNDLVAEFILPFSDNRIIFHSTKEDNPKVYRLFMEFFTSTWNNSKSINQLKGSQHEKY